MFRIFSFLISVCLLTSNPIITISGEINIVQDIDSTLVRTCLDYVDSCLYICSNGTINPCHPENLYPLAIDSNTGDTSLALDSHYRIYFPWEYNNLTADKFVVTASWPCISPTAVYARGNYVYWEILFCCR